MNVKCYMAVNYTVGRSPRQWWLWPFGYRRVLDIISLSYIIVYEGGSKGTASGELICKDFDPIMVLSKPFPQAISHPATNLNRLDNHEMKVRLLNRLVKEKGMDAPTDKNVKQLIKDHGLTRAEIGNEMYYLFNPHIKEFMGKRIRHAVDNAGYAYAIEMHNEKTYRFIPNTVEICVTDPIELFVLANAMGHDYSLPLGFTQTVLKPIESNQVRGQHYIDIGSVEWLARLREYHLNSKENELNSKIDELPDLATTDSNV